MKLFQMAIWALLAAGVCLEMAGNSLEPATPSFLYKILSVDNWNKSQSKDVVILSKEDAAFIHFATAEQLERIAEKYWGNIPEYVVLKVDTLQLPGRLVYEANPGGTTKYYHLYEGAIPLKAIVDVRVVKK